MTIYLLRDCEWMGWLILTYLVLLFVSASRDNCNALAERLTKSDFLKSSTRVGRSCSCAPSLALLAAKTVVPSKTLTSRLMLSGIPAKATFHRPS